MARPSANTNELVRSVEVANGDLTSGNDVRASLVDLNLKDSDIADAMAWARDGPASG